MQRLLVNSLFVIVTFFSMASYADTITMSRKKCLEIALQDNPTVKIADMEVKKVDYAKKETLASVFP